MNKRVVTIIVATVGCLFLLIVGIAVGPIPQSQTYHRFADDRTVFNIPNALNVISNFAFLVASHFGIIVLLFDMAAFRDKRERLAYWVLFISLLGVALGSAYYHFNPTNTTLIWDRLPMTIAFMAVVSIVITETYSLEWGLRLLWPLCGVGLASLMHWILWDDLRPYILVQIAPVLITPILVYWRPNGAYTSSNYMTGCAYWYCISKLAEALDYQIFTLLSVSGHTFKHLLAANGLFLIPWMLIKRDILEKEGSKEMKTQ